MIRITILLVFLLCIICWVRSQGTVSCGVANPITQQVTHPNTRQSDCQFPWIVKLHNQRTNKSCYGTIVSPTHILTIVHCFYRPPSTPGGEWVQIQPHELTVMSQNSILNVIGNVSQFIINGNLSYSVMANDTAVIKLEKSLTEYTGTGSTTCTMGLMTLRFGTPIRYSSCQSPLCLINSTMLPDNAINCKTLIRRSSNIHLVTTTISQQSNCRDLYNNNFIPNTFCGEIFSSNGTNCLEGNGAPYFCRASDGKHYVYGIAPTTSNCTFGRYVHLRHQLTFINQALAT